MFTAPLFGFVFGFFGSVPVAGPVAILVFSRGLEDRARSALYLSIGSALAESVYAYLAFWGFSELLAAYPWVQPLTRGAAAVILLALGLHFSRRRGDPDESRPPPDPKVGNKRSFFLGLTITALNPTLIATWTTAVALLHSLDIVAFDPHTALPFSVGVCVGICAWFALLLFLLGRYKDRFNRGTIDRTVRVMGLLLLGLGSLFAIRFLWGLGEML